MREHMSNMYKIQEEGVCNITIKEVSIKGTKETLVEAKVEGILVEEEEDRLYVIIVMNLDTWHGIVRICVRCARIVEHWITR
jgi:hypothetical protein